MGATPYTLRCPRCKKYRVWDHTRDFYDNVSHLNLVPTGRSKVIKKTTAGVLNVYSVEMKHKGKTPRHLGGDFCGHVFWTTHPHAVKKVFPNAPRVGNATVSNIGPRRY